MNSFATLTEEQFCQVDAKKCKDLYDLVQKAYDAGTELAKLKIYEKDGDFFIIDESDYERVVNGFNRHIETITDDEVDDLIANFTEWTGGFPPWEVPHQEAAGIPQLRCYRSNMKFIIDELLDYLYKVSEAQEPLYYNKE